MQLNRKHTAIVLTAGVALASAAYAVGSQSGDGQAAARDQAGTARGVAMPPPTGDHPPGLGLDDLADLADKLGVDADELQQALEGFRTEEHASHEAAFASALAKALGIDEQKAKDALDALEKKHEQERTDMRAAFAKRLANALGVEASKVESALDALAKKGPDADNRGPAGFATALADELGVDADKVEQALQSMRPERGRRVHRFGAGPPRAMLRELASELDVSTAELRQALRQIRPDRGGMKDPRSDLAAFLADRFNLDKSKVEDALGDLPGPRGPGFGPGSPGGHAPGGPMGPGGPGLGPPPGM